MKEKMKQWMRPVLFSLGGALLGLGYYYLVGCPGGNCLITSDPISTMVYMGVLGWLVSGFFERRCTDTCSEE